MRNADIIPEKVRDGLLMFVEMFAKAETVMGQDDWALLASCPRAKYHEYSKALVQWFCEPVSHDVQRTLYVRPARRSYKAPDTDTPIWASEIEAALWEAARQAVMETAEKIRVDTVRRYQSSDGPNHNAQAVLELIFSNADQAMDAVLSHMPSPVQGVLRMGKADGQHISLGKWVDEVARQGAGSSDCDQ